jgi:iron complex transport system substrate-binding protein
MAAWLASALTLVAGTSAGAQVHATDDGGRHITLAAPARRIVSLSPHATELLFAAGAGSHIVGALEFSNYPDAAKSIPRVGSNERLDIERIARLKPDLIVAWRHGGERQTGQLRVLNLPVYLSGPERLEDIGAAIESLAQLTGTEAVAREAARAYRERLAKLTQLHKGAAPVRVLLQIWHQPVMTVNGTHLMSHALAVCGGTNAFAGLRALAPPVDIESVLKANPDAIITTSAEQAGRPWLDAWKQWPRLTAVGKDQLYNVDPDLLTRHSPRVLDGVERLCAHLDAVRRKP